jgi:hypothetical protein
MSESGDDPSQAQAVQTMASTIPNPHHYVAPRIDSALELAYQSLSSEVAPIRPLHVRVMLKNQLSLTKLKRLAYQPQPISSTTWGFENAAQV